MNYILSYIYCNLDRVEYSGTDITSISDDVLGEASQAMYSGVYLVQCVRCPTVPSSGVLVGSSGFRVVFIMRWWWIVKWL